MTLIQNWTSSTFKRLYVACIHPHLEYCAAAWSPSSIDSINKLEAVQRRATKSVKSLRKMKYEERLKALGLTTLQERRVRGDLIQWFKVTKGFNKIHWIKQIAASSSLSSDGPASSTRGGPHKLSRQLTQCKHRDNFLSNRVIPFCNKLPNYVVESKSVISFKTNLDKHTSSDQTFFNFTTITA